MSGTVDPALSTWNYSMILEMDIDRPASCIWPWFFGEQNARWSKATYVEMSGQRGEPGSVYSMHSSVYGVRYFFEAMHVRPERELVLKITYARTDEEEPKLMGYDLFTLREDSGRTTVAFRQAFALPVDIPKADLALHTHGTDEFLWGIFRNLKTLVEAESPPPQGRI